MSKEELMLKVEIEKLRAEIKHLKEEQGNNTISSQQERVRTGKVKPAEKDISDITIAELFKSGLTPYKIGQIVGMTQQGIINRLKRMSLWKPRKSEIS